MGLYFILDLNKKHNQRLVGKEIINKKIKRKYVNIIIVIKQIITYN